MPVDDGVDKLNRKYTLLVFLFLALPIFTKQYIGDPIECFTPTYFTEPQARYVNSYCWTASTYYLVAADQDDEDYDIVGQVGKNQEPPDPRVLPEELDYGGFDVASTGPERLRRVRVGYYQWAPLILLVQGCCKCAPSLAPFPARPDRVPRLTWRPAFFSSRQVSMCLSWCTTLAPTMPE